jgi:hypothetical protein
MTTTATTTPAQGSRRKELLRGMGWSLLVVIPGLATAPFLGEYVQVHRHDDPRVRDWGSLITFFPYILAVLASLALVIRWWRLARWRAYGVLCALFALPPTLIVLAVAWIIVFNVQIMPH